MITTAYGNLAKPTYNPTQNQGMSHYKKTSIKELKTLIEPLRKSLTNLTTKHPVEPDQKKKKTQPQTNKTEYLKITNQTKTQLKRQTPSIHTITAKSNPPHQKKYQLVMKAHCKPKKKISLKETI